MESGKALVLSSVSKRSANGHFQARHIVDDTGLDRQLVYYHLSKFVDRGWIQKTAKYYLVTDLPAIIDELITENRNDGHSKPEGYGGGLLSPRLANKGQEACQAAALGLPMSKEYVERFMIEIDLALDYLKAIKKFMNNYQPSLVNAAKHFDKDRTLYDMMTENFKVPPLVSQDEWNLAVSVRVEEILEG